MLKIMFNKVKRLIFFVKLSPERERERERERDWMRELVEKKYISIHFKIHRIENS